MTDETTWLTPAAHTKLSEEYEALTNAGRRHIEERIAEARSHGDLRENADYDAAKNEQGMMEARIRQLKHLLENAEVREAVDTGKVEIGSIVTVTNGDLTLEVLVAGSENRVSVEPAVTGHLSPVAGRRPDCDHHCDTPQVPSRSTCGSCSKRIAASRRLATPSASPHFPNTSGTERP